MGKLIYNEEQSFRESFILWVMIAAWLLIILMFGYAFYKQLYLGQPFGDNPSSDKGLIWGGIGSIFTMSVVFIFMLNSHLVTEIWSDGIRYKFPPLLRKERFIPISDIASVEVGKYRPLGEFGGWGWRRRPLSRKTAFNIAGNKGMRVVLKSGKQFIFGTQKEDELKRAVSKMVTKESANYSV